MEYILIVNPAAGKANAAMSLLPRLTRYCKEQGLAYTVEATQYPGHGQQISAKWAATGREVCLCACGGDGTLHEVINGAYGFSNATVACFPCGTGNDFVRTFGAVETFLDPRQLVEGEALHIDLIRTQMCIRDSHRWSNDDRCDKRYTPLDGRRKYRVDPKNEDRPPTGKKFHPGRHFRR